MTLDELINEYEGQRVFLTDPDYLGECTQICKIWAKRNGWPIPNSGGTNKALDYKNYRNGYEFIENTPDNVPTAGDIVVWGRQVGYYGHVAIFVSGNEMLFKSFDQNWPQGSSCHTQDHNYFGVIGWLHLLPVKPLEAPVAAFEHAFNTNLTPGMVDNEEVKILQQRLKQLGFFPPEIDATGNYKSITKKAVFELQYKYGVLQNPTDYGAGYFGPLTRAVINKL